MVDLWLCTVCLADPIYTKNNALVVAHERGPHLRERHPELDMVRYTKDGLDGLDGLEGLDEPPDTQLR